MEIKSVTMGNRDKSMTMGRKRITSIEGRTASWKRRHADGLERHIE